MSDSKPDMLTFEHITGNELSKTSPLTTRGIQLTIDHIDEVYGKPDGFRSQRFASFVAAAIGSQIEGAVLQLLLRESMMIERITELEARLAALEGPKAE